MAKRLDSQKMNGKRGCGRPKLRRGIRDIERVGKSAIHKRNWRQLTENVV